jgi:hypothetical protein
MDSQSAGLTLRVWKKIALATVRLLVHGREITARHPTSQRKFNRRAHAVRFIAQSLSPIDPTALI